MRNRNLKILALLSLSILLLGLLGFPGGGRQSSSQTGIESLSLGYGPSSLSPINMNSRNTSLVPIYTVNDEMWFETSTFPVTVTLTAAGTNGSARPSEVVGPETISPQAVVSLFQFSSGDPTGIWTLNVFFSNSSGSVSIPIQFLGNVNQVLGTTKFSYSLKGSRLVTNFTLASSSNIYDAQGCVVGNVQNTSIPIPSNLGSGRLRITNNLGDSEITISGSVSNPFSFWYELSYPYSYAKGVSSQIVTQNRTTARSDAVFVSPGSTTLHTSITSLVGSQRLGRAELIGFFDSGSGISVEPTRVLLLNNDSWFWLGGNCLVLSSIHPGQSFAPSFDLTAPSPSLPSGFIAMSQINGVEVMSSQSIRFDLSRISFRLDPGNVAPGNGISISAGSSVPSSSLSISNGTIFLISPSYPTQVNYSLSFGGRQFDSGATTLRNASLSNEIIVTVSEIGVQVNNNGKAQAGVPVVLDGNLETLNTGANGVVLFYVPQGNHSVSVTLNNSTQQQWVNTTTGQESAIEFFFTSSYPGDSLLPYLEAAALIGVLANLWVWVIRPRMGSRTTL